LRRDTHTVDLFEKLLKDMGPLGKHAKTAHGYFTFPQLEGEIAPHMKFRGKDVLVWSLNNYLGLANHPEIRKADADAARDYGMAYPMGARMMSGDTKIHVQLEQELSEFIGKEETMLLNFGYQGVMSIIDALLSRHDIAVYDAESHASIVDGLRMHQGKRLVYPHNDMAGLEKQLQRAERLAAEHNGAILVITEGVFGMSGNQGKLKEIIELKKKYNFRLLVDDAHGFGTMGPSGAGTGEAQDCQDGVDLYFSTFAKSMASIGAFVSGDRDVINYLRYNTRSQIYAKSLPMPLVVGALKRLELLRNHPELREKLWVIVNALKDGFKARGFDIGTTTAPVIPVVLKGDEGMAAHLVIDLRENFGIFCSIVVYPVIPRGMMILRIIPTATHSLNDVNQTLEAFSAVQEKLNTGAYSSDLQTVNVASEDY
jgi:glycine C-acetyltransferase